MNKKNPFDEIPTDAYGNKRPVREFFRDAYGCTASIYRRPNDPVVNLTVCDAHGNIIVKWMPYRTYRGAKIALGKMSDGTMKLTGREMH